MKKEEELFFKMARLMIVSDTITAEIYKLEDSIKELKEKRDLVLKKYHGQEYLAKKHLKLGSYQIRMRFLNWSIKNLLNSKENLAEVMDEVTKEINQ